MDLDAAPREQAPPVSHAISQRHQPRGRVVRCITRPSRALPARGGDDIALSLHLTPGAPHRVTDTCPECGWADIWEITLYVLKDDGPIDVASARRCLRCESAERGKEHQP